MVQQQLSVKVDLSKLNLKKTQKNITKGIDRGIKKAEIHLIGAMKREYAGAGMIHPTGRIMGSVQGSDVPNIEHARKVGPSVVYSGSVEDGNRSPHAPASIKASGFTGYQVVQKTAKKSFAKVKFIIEREIRRKIK